jgi:hypothetical protein
LTISLTGAQSPNVKNKADAEKKQHKSLPPKKKARLLDTKAATQNNHRESLFLDDKVQI